MIKKDDCGYSLVFVSGVPLTKHSKNFVNSIHKNSSEYDTIYFYVSGRNIFMRKKSWLIFYLKMRLRLKGVNKRKIILWITNPDYYYLIKRLGEKITIFDFLDYKKIPILSNLKDAILEKNRVMIFNHLNHEPQLTLVLAKDVRRLEVINKIGKKLL